MKLTVNTNGDKDGLQDLHHRMVDCRKVYAQVARRAGDPRVSGLLQVIQPQHAAMEAELGTLLRMAESGMASGKGTVQGDLHRAWTGLCNALGVTGNANLLAACLRGQHMLLMRYDELLGKDGFTMAVREVLQRQLTRVKDQAGQTKSMHNKCMETGK